MKIGIIQSYKYKTNEAIQNNKIWIVDSSIQTANNIIKAYPKDQIYFGMAKASKIAEIKELKKIPHLTCLYCGKEMIPCNILDLPTTENETALEFSNKIIAKVLEYKKNLMPIESKVLKKIENMHKQNPELNLLEIMNAIRPKPLKRLSKIQLNVFKIIDELAKKIPSETRIKIYEITSASRKAVNEDNPQNRFKKKDFNKALSALREKMPEKDYTLITKIANLIPSSTNNEDAFITNYSNAINLEDKDEIKKVARALMKRKMATIEHIRAQNKFQPDENIKMKHSIENLALADEYCNGKKGNRTVKDYITRHPIIFIKQYPQRQINIIIDAINSGTIKDCNDYPQAYKNAWKVETDGIIDLDISKLKK